MNKKLIVILMISLVLIAAGCAKKEAGKIQTEEQVQQVQAVEGSFVNELADFMVQSTSNETSSN